jgi:hypothetical protein
MKRASITLAALLALAAAFLGAGCTTPAPQNLPTVVIALRPVGDRAPAPDEIRQTLEALRPALSRAGASLTERRDLADFVLTVTFTPATGSSGSRVIVNGLEPTARQRDAMDGGETPETKEFRRRIRGMENQPGGHWSELPQ